MYSLYNILLLLASLGALPYFAIKSLHTTKYRAGLRQRFGHVPPEIALALRGVRPLWLHAVSVGEVIAAVPLVSALRQRFPHLLILISTVTETGQATAREKMAGAACLYFPLDYPWVVHQVISRLQPRLFLMVETEIWPNFLRELTRQAIPAILVNGRISPRSFRGYRRLRPFMCRVLPAITSFSMQTKLDAERIIAIGAEPSRVHITGNIKYDLAFEPLTSPDERTFRADLGIGEAPVFMAGSTHRGEEDIVIRPIYGRAFRCRRCAYCWRPGIWIDSMRSKRCCASISSWYTDAATGVCPLRVARHLCSCSIRSVSWRSSMPLGR